MVCLSFETRLLCEDKEGKKIREGLAHRSEAPKSISKMSESFYGHIRFRVGDGTKIHFWMKS